MGYFLNICQKNIKENSKVTVIEPEPISFKILESLYPHTQSLNDKFEDTTLNNNSYDLVIGNPPYGYDKVIDKDNPDLTKTVITDYFVARGVRLLKKKGILAFVVNQYCLDMVRDHIRDVIAKEGGNLLAAYRLPDNVFKDASVTTDVIFIVKDKLPTKWLKTKPYIINNKTRHINEYYIDNPQNILGKFDIIDVRGKKHLICKANGNLKEKLSATLKSFSTQSESTVADKKPTSSLDINTRVNNYVNTLLIKHWKRLLKSINQKRNLFLSDRIFLNLEKPDIVIEHIKSKYSIDLTSTKDEVKSNSLIETPLQKKEYYFEINLSFKNKILYSDNFYIESVIEAFLNKNIRDKFKHKIYFSYS